MERQEHYLGSNAGLLKAQLEQSRADFKNSKICLPEAEPATWKVIFHTGSILNIKYANTGQGPVLKRFRTLDCGPVPWQQINEAMEKPWGIAPGVRALKGWKIDQEANLRPDVLS